MSGKECSLVPASPFGHEELPEGVNGVVEIHRSPQKRHQVVPGDLIGTELGKEHRLKFDVDVDLLQHLLHDLPILTREFNIGGTLDLDLAPVDFALLLLVGGQEFLGMGDALGHVRPIADQLRARISVGMAHGPKG